MIWPLVIRRSLTGTSYNRPKNFLGGSSTPLLCRKYLRMRNLVFCKIYAHKWLNQAVCGHNIFFVAIRWRRRRDSNPCGVSPKRFSRPPRYDHFDTSPHIIITKGRWITKLLSRNRVTTYFAFETITDYFLRRYYLKRLNNIFKEPLKKTRFSLNAHSKNGFVMRLWFP